MLAHDVLGQALGEGTRTAVFLHGILGSRNNWRSFAQRFVDAHEGWRAITCDLRNHGESHGLPPPHTVEACAADVARTVAALGGALDLLVGHSFGGKVALALAGGRAAGDHEVRPKETWVLDCPPGPRPVTSEDGSDVGRVLDVVTSIPMPIESRRALVEAIRARGLPNAIAQWMTTNLRRDDESDAFVWRFDLQAIPEMLASFGALDLWPVVEAPSPDRGRLVVVRAGRGGRFSGADIARLTRAAARGTVVERVMPEAGHWLHSEDPEGVLALLGDGLRERHEGGA